MKHLKDLDKFDTLGFETYLESIKMPNKPIPDKKDPRDSKDFEEAFKVWKNDREQEEGEPVKDDEDLHEEYEQNLQESGLFDAIDDMLTHGLLKVSRAMMIDPDNLTQGKPLGIYWCFESKREDTYNWDAEQEEGSMISIHGKASADNVDWETTFALNAVEDNEEFEIRMKHGSPVEVYKYAVKSDEYKPNSHEFAEKVIHINTISVKC